jgi:fructan beta-fructosidase
MLFLKKIAWITTCVAALTSCTPKDHAKSESSSSDSSVVRSANERHRPQIHFTPQKGWMNDPNGMFYLNGEYHLFYQHYPDTTVWGPMHWGHAVSKDMMHWEHQPIALYPDSLGYIFSGSAVVDTNNTSGFGTKDNPAVVAIFTYHDATAERAGKSNFQNQGIAYSLDGGRSWTKYAHNPVLKNPGLRDFRDPKVSWFEEGRQWVMTLAVKDHVEFYGSQDLKTWKKLGEFGKHEGSHDGVWECPDLFKITDSEGKQKDVLLLSINPGAPNGGSGTQYFVGRFDGRSFVSDTPGKNAGWIDYGTDDYAGVTFANVPATDGRRLFMGWMSNWLYGERVPTETWRSAMTIPRELTLEQTQQGPILKSMPVKELTDLVASSADVAAATDADTVHIFTNTHSSFSPIVIGGSIGESSFIIELRNSLNQKTAFGFQADKNQYYIDRGLKTNTSFHKDFAARIVAPRHSDSSIIEFLAVIDVASIELFLDGGRTTMTATYFPDEVYREVRLYRQSSRISIAPGTIKVRVLKSAP